ncbi:hypothetical protein G6F59_015069 [Rhizopus arrhizus]|nr:hypothetical protein G6F59_015069 [Rhizopus arrhizus]
MAGLGEDAADCRTAQGGPAPHARHQRQGARPEGRIEHQPDQRIAERKENAAAQPLDAAAGQQHRHAGRQSPDDGAGGEDGDGYQRRSDDGGHDEQCRVPGVVLQPPDVLDDAGQDSGHDIDIAGVQRHAACQGDGAQGVGAMQQVGPGSV